MSSEQIEKMIAGGRLILGLRRRLVHYCFPIFLTIASIGLSWGLIIGWSKGEHSKYFPIAVFLVFVLFPFLTISTFIIQYRALKLLQFKTELSANINHRLAVQAFRKMHWEIKINQSEFVEASNPNTDMYLTRGHELMSVIISERMIFINCICSVDTIWFQVAITFGKTKQWVNKFKEHFVASSGKIHTD